MSETFVDQFEVIAERELQLADSDKTSAVFVRLGKPFEMPAGEWACPFQITGIGDDTIRSIFGIDAIQALQLTLSVIPSFLQSFQGDRRLSHLGSEDLGFSQKELS